MSARSMSSGANRPGIAHGIADARVFTRGSPRCLWEWSRAAERLLHDVARSLARIASTPAADPDSPRNRTYHYDLAARALQTNSIRVRLATLGSFGKWAERHGRLPSNPFDQLSRPRGKKRLPAVPRWAAVEDLLDRCARLRDRAILALLRVRVWSAAGPRERRA